jgi:predicted TIM-barrel fold metal-dependent hydrolase
MIDVHTHMGQFFKLYISPARLSSFMKQIGAEKYAVSSTSMCEENDQKVLDEFHQLEEIDGNNILPTLWITPRLLIEDKEHLYLDSGIPWKYVKIHPELHPNVWDKDEELFGGLMDVVNELKVPLLIHTGETEGCNPLLFTKFAEKYPQNIFVFAHGRPRQETLEALKRPNILSDTALTPIENIKAFVEAGYEDKIMWGTDSCIILHYRPETDLEQDYKNRLSDLKKVVSETAFTKITSDNAKSVFGLRDMSTPPFKKSD